MAARRFAIAMAFVSSVQVPLARGDDALPVSLPEHGFVPRPRHDDGLKVPARREKEVRDEALVRARLWRRPDRPIAEADLRRNPDGPRDLSVGDHAVCKFLPKVASGSTPKFFCVFEDGEVLKVKYGGDPEIQTEVAATRLLHALGAGADHVYLVKKLRCFGCPADPQAMSSCLSSPSDLVRSRCEPRYGQATADGAFAVRVRYGSFRDFGPVSVERRLEGQELRVGDREGWGWDELDRQPGSGGASRAERDALRLLAVFLNNWDNRPDNQRLLCLPGGASGPDTPCPRPFAYMDDPGSTFGGVKGAHAARKLDLPGWRQTRVWKDPETCRVDLESPRLHRATLGEAVISESGRRLLAERLGRLTKRQIRDLFEGSGFADASPASPASRDVDAWVTAFQDKVRQITERPPCPEA
jgi:hypothetical protein